MKRFAEALQYHRNGNDGPDETLIRLVRQHCQFRLVDPVEVAPAEGRLTVREEVWPVRKLQKLWLAHDRSKPRKFEGPLIVLRVNGVDALIDGNNRCRKLLQDGGAASWPVLIVEIR